MTGGGEPSAEALALLDAAPCGLMQTSDDGLFRRVNRTFCLWVGYSSEALVGRRRFQDLLTMGGRIFHQTHWSPLLRMQGSISEVKLEIVHHDGTLLPMVVNAVRQDRDGDVVHEIAAYVARDRDKYERELVLSRKRLEQLVAEAERLQAEAKDRALFAEQMIGIVSHDLRNPINGIAIGAQLLGRGELSGAQQSVLERIRRATDRATRLVGDLLDFTQARVGKGLAVVLEPGDLHEAVAEATDEVSLAYPRRTVTHVRVGDGLCAIDANRISQLVGNLVSNAFTYGTPDGTVTVTSTIAPTTFSIAVHNHGDPIPEEARARLFQPMTRGVHATSTVRNVGLGLFIVREIARAHGGQTVVTSSREEGTTFLAICPRG